MKNKYCDSNDLSNESNVEQFFIIRLLKNLGFGDKDIKTKESIDELVIGGKGRKKEKYKPDYVLFVGEKPIVVIDAKSPQDNIDDYVYQGAGYSLTLNQKYKGENPVKYFILTNGLIFNLYNWDEEEPLLSLDFEDFTSDSPKFLELKNLLFKNALVKLQEGVIEERVLFKYKKPDLTDIKGIFVACHNLIWKKEKIKPSDAFYEFSKIMFVKLDCDKKLRTIQNLRERIEKELPIPTDDIVFSSDWIKRGEKTDPNPFDSILFKNLRNKLEREITARRKKRIFEPEEHIKLRPSTIKEVIKLLEHYDLFGIDEDLNGRLFETFLSAIIRGRELGQFFTPRSVVKFMTKLADLKVDKQHVDRVLDACCGTAGFLIEAMADMSTKIDNNKSLSDLEKSELEEQLKNEYLFGIDASEMITRIARINMYLHGDGGSKIYYADSLDKKLYIEDGIPDEIKIDQQELTQFLIKEGIKFGVVLTNPPFAMRYEKKKEDEKRILKEYRLSYEDRKRRKKMRSSLKSNVMFIERYWDLLKSHGKLLTVIDESILNTDSSKPFRDYIKEKFIIKAVISLPRNAFVNAGSSVKTSILYLVKKINPEESQSSVFMAKSENIGHDDVGRPKPELNDLDSILEEFRKFESGKNDGI